MQKDNSFDIKIKTSDLLYVIKKSLQGNGPKDFKPLLLVGSPGSGKTECINSVVTDLGYEKIDIHGVTADPTDVKGMPSTWKEGTKQVADWLPFGDMQRMIEVKEPLVVFYDDVGNSIDMVQSGFGQLVQGRCINGYRISDTVRFIAATNSRKDKTGIRGIISSFVNRFTVLEYEPDVESWIQWAKRNGIHGSVIDFVRVRPALFNDYVPTSDIKNNPSPRAIKRMSDWIKDDVSILSVLSGAVGESFAIEYLAFMSVYKDLKGLPDDCIKNPTTARVPDKGNVLYALVGVFRHRADKNNMSQIFEYAKRMPAEFRTLLFEDLKSKGKDKDGNQIEGDDLTQTAAYVSYISGYGADMVNAIN